MKREDMRDTLEMTMRRALRQVEDEDGDTLDEAMRQLRVADRAGKATARFALVVEIKLEVDGATAEFETEITIKGPPLVVKNGGKTKMDTHPALPFPAAPAPAAKADGEASAGSLEGLSRLERDCATVLELLGDGNLAPRQMRMEDMYRLSSMSLGAGGEALAELVRRGHVRVDAETQVVHSTATPPAWPVNAAPDAATVVDPIAPPEPIDEPPRRRRRTLAEQAATA